MLSYIQLKKPLWSTFDVTTECAKIFTRKLLLLALKEADEKLDRQ
jgi:hypothetical protein